MGKSALWRAGPPWYNDRVSSAAQREHVPVPIRLLPPELASKIAAGEVIERPVSVVKELIENAIDAGATHLDVSIEQGGRRLIRVQDDGCGIPADQVELAFARHATSKLFSAEGLYNIRTLGFRGEALASIAAVSHVTLSTKTADEDSGTRIRLEGGRVARVEAVGRPSGTTVTVEHLFYNTPPRLKFLRTDATEAGHIARLVSAYALAFPALRFSLTHHQRSVLRTMGTGALYDAIVAVYGLDIAEEMLEIPRENHRELRVWGYVSSSAVHRSTRQDVTLFVNRRWVQDSSLSYAISEAYRSLLPQRRHPVVVLHIELPPHDVDVNVHPTKREVRFQHPRDVFSAVQRAVRTTLMAQGNVPVIARITGEYGGWPTADSASARSPSLLLPDDGRDGGVVRGVWAPANEAAELVGGERLPMLRVIGQLAQTYVLAEGPGGLYLIDQHAAHERIRYEELSSQVKRAAVISQELLEPRVVELSPRQAELVEEHLDDLARVGLVVSPFGSGTVLVRSVPQHLMGGDIASALTELVETAEDGGEAFSWVDQAMVTLSCHTAVRAGQTLSLDEMRDLVRSLERCALPHTCPHGRPTLVHMTRGQLEREFGRR